jgi:uncharacterized membrane protein
MMGRAMRASLFVRVLAIGVVAASPWMPAKQRPSDARSVVFVVDRSMSVGSQGVDNANEFLRIAWSKSKDEKLGVVAFDGRAEVVAPLGAFIEPKIDPPESWMLDAERDGKAEGAADPKRAREPWASDPAAGVRLATALLPRSGHRSIVLLTDARATRGDVEAEVRAAAAQGIRVDLVSISGERPKTMFVTGIKPRSLHVAEGQPVALDVTLVKDAEEHGYAVIDWTRDGVRMPQQMAYPKRLPNGDLDPDASVELIDPSPPPGPHIYEARARRLQGKHAIGSQFDPSPAAMAAVTVEGKAYAAVFSSMGTVPPVLAASLAESKLEARGLPLDRLGDPAAYSGADLVVLSDVRVSGAAIDDTALTRSAQASLIDYVEQGGGLLVTGGVFGLAPEYAGTPIARILPVEIEDKGHVEDPPVALAMMLDRSGSMGANVGTHTKIELAIEASLGAADVLRPSDFVALGTVDTETHWDVPLGPAQQLAALRPQVRSVRAGGGGIYVFTALRDAYASLESVQMPLRHVILFSDTSDSEEQEEPCQEAGGCAKGRRTAEELAHAARVRGITTTVVGIGDEGAKDTEFLKRVAGAAGGRFYLTAEGSDLRRIFLSETRVLAQSNLHQKPISVAADGTHPVLTGFDVAKLPSLAAYVETKPRAGAETPLVLASGEGRPMLATWRYGLGKVAAITTDLVEGWGGAWAASPEASQLLRQTARHILRQQSAHRADAEIRVRDRAVEVSIELPPDVPESAAPRQLDVFAIDHAGASRKLTANLEHRGPGQYVARARSNGEPVIVARARDAKGAMMAESLGREDRTMEYAGTGPDDHLIADLARLGEGRVDPSPEGTLVRTKHPATELQATWPWALVAAGALIVLDLFLRRLRSKAEAAYWNPPGSPALSTRGTPSQIKFAT